MPAPPTTEVPLPVHTPGVPALLGVVLVKELRETLRDANSLIFSVLFPLLFFPMVMWLFTQVSGYLEGQARPARVEVHGDVPLAEGVEVVEAGADVVARREGDVVRIAYRSTDPASDRAMSSVRRSVEGTWPVRTTEVAPDEDEGFTQALARAVPIMLVIFGMLGGLYPAVEAIVAEQERGTVETTLLTAVPRWVFFAGKLGSVLFMALLALASNMVAIGLTMSHLISLLGAEVDFPVGRLLATLPVGIAVTVFTAALALLAAAPTRSFKQAQNTTSGAATGIMALAGLGMAPGIELDLGWSLVPVTNAVLVMSEQIAGRSTGPWGIVTVVELLLLSVPALAVTARVASRGTLG